MNNHFHIISKSDTNETYESVVAMGVYYGDQIDWVRQAIASIKEQTYRNFIFAIVIDGEVSNQMQSLLTDFACQNGNVILIQAEHNLGLSQCMNFVVDWSLENIPNTKFFFRMDSDDISLPERFSQQVDFFSKNNNVSVLGTSLVEINENGKKVGKRELPMAHYEIERLMPRRCAINHPTVAVRMSVFSNGFRYRDYLKNTQDYFLWIELCSAGYKFANLPTELLQFRRVNDFYKRRGLSKSINEFKARFYAMKVLKRYSLGNLIYAFAVLLLRLMPAKIVKLAYKIDRYFLNKQVGN